jgi:hypothetical protein
MQAEAQALIDSLRQNATQRQAEVASAAETSVAQVESLAAAKLAAVSAQLSAQKAQAAAAHTQAKTALNQALAAQKAALDTQKETQLAAIDAQGLQNIAQLRQQLTERRTNFDTYVAQQKQQPRAISEREAARAASELQSAASEAIQVGEAEAARRTEDKAKEAARKVASESADDIRAKIPSIRQDLLSRASEVDGKFQEYLDTIHQNLDQAEQSAVPAFQQAIDTAKHTVEEAHRTATTALEQRNTQDMAAVDASQTAVNQQLDAAAEQARNQIRSTKTQTVQDIRDAANSLRTSIQARLTEAESVVGGLQSPYVPGVADVIAAKSLAIDETANTGVSSINGMANGAEAGLQSPVDHFNSSASGVISQAQSGLSGIQSASESAMTATVQGFGESANQANETMNRQHTGMTTDLMGEVDRAIEEARGKVQQIVQQYQTDIVQAANDAITEAKKPLTDPLFIRVFEAADRTNQPWWQGAIRALVSILEGFIILVVVALVVAAIAAAFGVFLTAWTAIMIAGAILLLIGFAAALYNRWNQPELAGNRLGAVGMAFLDTIGVTGIIESGSLSWLGVEGGRDLVTGRTLGLSERTERGIMGWFTAITLAVGVRAAIKGPPGGTFTRPVEIPSTSILGRMGQGVSGVLGEIGTGIRNLFRRGEERPVEENNTQENNTQENSTQENTTQENTTQENTTQENTTQENTTQENTTQENTTQKNTTQENTTQENTTQENTTQENTTQENTTQENTTQENTTQENTTQENTTQENTTQENQTPENRTQEPPTRNPKYPDYRPCFIAGTKVLTTTGAKNIEELVIGSKVVSNCGTENTPIPYEITATLGGKTQNLVEISIGDGSVVATRDHQFLVAEDGWLPSRLLEIGQYLTTPTGIAEIVGLREIVLEEPVSTFNITVDIAHTYFVQAGNSWVLAHNDDPFDQILYWLFGKKPDLRPTDHDGLSIWKTSSREEVNLFFRTRVHEAPFRSTGDAHSYYTEQQLQEMQIIRTDSDNVLAERGLEHYSLRQSGISAEPEYHLTAEEMTALRDALTGLEKSTAVKPSTLDGQC